jgi:hypothetical protein
MEDFFSIYLDYTDETESPKIYHRWAAISGIAALLGKQYYFQHGAFVINPNLYIFLMGVAGCRKSAAILYLKKLLVKFGYNTISADKTSKEQFLIDLAESSKVNIQDDKAIERFLNSPVDFKHSDEEISESYIIADEFNDFFGTSYVLDFITCLGKLWDHEGNYSPKLKNNKSLVVPQPIVNMLCGNTPTNFARIFPPEILGQGFFSRMLLIHGEPTGKKITFLKEPDPVITKYILELFGHIKSSIVGPASFTPIAMKLIDKIYKSPINFHDVRFESYPSRRFPHLIKLCLIISAVRLSTQVTEQDVITANTLLTYAEHFMPKALGEFGKAKNSDVSHKIIQFIETSDNPPQLSDIWMQVSNDLDRFEMLGELLRSLSAADKIQGVKNGEGVYIFLPKRRVMEFNNSDVLDFSCLTDEERGKIS